jgi:hypothetical protein
MSTSNLICAVMTIPSPPILSSSEITDPVLDHSDKAEADASTESRIYREHSPTQPPRDDQPNSGSFESVASNSTVRYHHYLRLANQNIPATSVPWEASMAELVLSLPPGMTPSNHTQEGGPAFDPGEMRHEVFPQNPPTRPTPKGNYFARLFKRHPGRSEDIELGQRQDRRRRTRQNHNFFDESPSCWIIFSFIFLVVLALMAWGMVSVDRSPNTVPSDGWAFGGHLEDFGFPCVAMRMGRLLQDTHSQQKELRCDSKHSPSRASSLLKIINYCKGVYEQKKAICTFVSCPALIRFSSISFTLYRTCIFLTK